MRDESADQIFEELQDIVQQAILRDYPNPERKGCPGPDVLRELAKRPRPTRDTAWKHVTHCSPCYREFLDLRTEVRAQAKSERRRAQRRRAVVAGAAVVAAAAIIGGYELLNSTRPVSQTPGTYQTASLDLKDRPVTRSVDEQSASARVLVLPAKRLDLTILLPSGSQTGPYEIQLLKTIDEPLLTVSGDAAPGTGATLLRTKLDLSGRAAGPFLIGLRHPPSDWTYFPVIIKP